MPFDTTPILPAITDEERNALIAVRNDLLSGRIPPTRFDMRYANGPCRCIYGHLSERGDTYFSLHDSRFKELFYLEKPEDSPAFYATPAQAASAIDNFLTTGKPQWRRVMKSTL